MASIHDLTFRELESALVADGVHPSHTRTLWRAVHRRGATDFSDCPDFLPPLARWVSGQAGAGRRFSIDQPSIEGETASGDGLTRKFLLRLEDGQRIETVLMDYTGRSTACVSTQAGCAMGCVFCATGQMGFLRHLRAGEIVAQVLHVQRVLKSAGLPGVTNLVLMGMGEPLHNYDAVMTALEILTDSRGVGIAPRRATISTVGVIPGILRLADENRPFNLAVSLHSADAAERATLVPAGRRWPLGDLIEACRKYGSKTGRRIFFEWTLIAGVNDTPAHATQLAGLLTGMHAHVNLIPLNQTSGFAGQESGASVGLAFQAVLRERGLPSTVRQRRGIDVAAGCGQLRSAGSRPGPS